jgi:hypothetical protein
MAWPSFGYVHYKFDHAFWTKPADCMQSYLVELINKRRHSDEKGEKRDLLSNLVNANEEFSGDGEQRLGEEELIGACQ